MKANTTQIELSNKQMAHSTKQTRGFFFAKNRNHEMNEEEFFLEEPNSWIAKVTLMIFLTIFCVCITYGQKQYQRIVKPGFGMELSSSGNGHGGFYTPYASMNAGPHHVMLAAVLHKKSGTMSGYKLMYSLNLSGGYHAYRANMYSGATPDLFQINWFTYFQQVRATPLSSSVVKYEQRIVRESMVDWSKVQLSTLELGSGIELRININQIFSIRNCVGAAVYYHTNYISVMDHEQIAPTLNLSTGINITLQ